MNARRRITVLFFKELVQILDVYKRQVIKSASELLKTNTSLLLEKITAMNEELKSTKKELSELKKAEMNSACLLYTSYIWTIRPQHR